MAEAYLGRGNAYWQQGSADRAMADWEAALCLKRPAAAVLINRGNAYREIGSLDEAILDLDSAVHSLNRESFGEFAQAGDGYFYRAVARSVQQEWLGAKGDLVTARQEGVLVASSFRNIFGGVSASNPDMALECLPSWRQCCM